MILPFVLALLQSPEPILDGTISPAEWSQATRETGSNGLEVFLYPTDSVLYVAVRGRGDGFPHLALLSGDTVFILHASAALGTAKYAPAAGSRHLIQPFSFGVRGTALGGQAQAEREAFYAREGWVASTVRMGQAGETEFKIGPSRLQAGRRIAVAYWAEGSGVSVWPASLADATATERMVQGFLPDTAGFRPEDWGRWPTH
jgi:hypothetical protein